MENWNKESIHDLMRDIEITEGATMERNALINLFDYIRELENSYELSNKRNNEANLKISQLNSEIGGHAGRVEALSEEMVFLANRMKLLKKKMITA